MTLNEFHDKLEQHASYINAAKVHGNRATTAEHEGLRKWYLKQ